MRLPSPSRLLLVVICLGLSPTSVQAHGVITGQIDDAVGNGVPGVTVDALGVAPFDARIVTKATVMADEHGRYQLDLPPGVYAVRFSLLGFGTVIHEGIGIEDHCLVPVDARLWQIELRAGVTVQGVHPDAGPSSMAGRLPPVRRDTRTRWRGQSAATPLVECAPRSDTWSRPIERQLFWKHIADACFGYVPM